MAIGLVTHETSIPLSSSTWLSYALEEWRHQLQSTKRETSGKLGHCSEKDATTCFDLQPPRLHESKETQELASEVA